MKKALKCAFAVLECSVDSVDRIDASQLEPKYGICRLGQVGARVSFWAAANLMERISLFAHLMTWMPEYRNVFYLRTGILGKLLSIFCRPKSSLYLGDTSVGPAFLSCMETGRLFQPKRLARIVGLTNRLYSVIAMRPTFRASATTSQFMLERR